MHLTSSALQLHGNCDYVAQPEDTESQCPDWFLVGFVCTVNKQLADKERVAAALENSHLLEVVNQCLSARS